PEWHTGYAWCVDLQSHLVCSCQRIDHVQIVGPGFCPVFPGMSAGVTADMVCLPVSRRTVVVMVLQAAGIVLGFVSKQFPERCQPARFIYQSEPVVVTRFVTEMTEH